MTRRAGLIIASLSILVLIPTTWLLLRRSPKPPTEAQPWPPTLTPTPPPAPPIHKPPLAEGRPALRAPSPPPLRELVTPPMPDTKPTPPPRDLRRSEVVRLPTPAGDRVVPARERAEPALRGLFEKAGVRYPAERLFLRAFKREAELEMWATDTKGVWKLIVIYGVEGASGGPGPKRREGDGQVPEGFYQVDRFNPKSSFHLSLGINYPNAADRILSDPKKPGYDIFIHGRAVSIGCLAMGDDRIEEIYLAALDTRTRPIPVHIFPGRMDAPDWMEWSAEQTQSRADLATLWEELRAGWEAFELHRKLPRIEVLPNGRYAVRVP